MSRATVLVADDHPALLAAVSSYLEAHDFDVTALARDGEHAYALAAEHQPDVALIDWRMPRRFGADLVSAVAAVSPRTRIVVYTADGDQTLAREAYDAGAVAVLLKEAPLADVVRAVEAALAGRTYLDPALRRPSSRSSSLTEREIEVLSLLADGLRHDEIGKRLGIGSETVRTHLRKASDRLGAATRTQAVATALRQGLIS
jgi:two-component system, NarL family, nitrate/nitrite response regulator NarL